MNRCKDCRWWGKPRELDQGYALCNHPLFGDEAYPWKQYPRDGILDGESNAVGIHTGPEFGCVHHEPRRTT